MTTEWTIEAAAHRYQIASWGDGYFGINQRTPRRSTRRYR